MIKYTKVKNKQGEKLFVEIHSPAAASSTVVFVHGFTGCRKGRSLEDNYMQTFATKLCRMGFRVILFDMSGHGESEGLSEDVTLDKSVGDLTSILTKLKVGLTRVNFICFSYGAAVLTKYLEQNKSVWPRSISLISPCIYPLDSCFLNSKSVFGKDIAGVYKSGKLAKVGCATIGAKGFKVGFDFIQSLIKFKPDYLSKYADKILCLSGRDDIIMDTSFVDKFCNQIKITNHYFAASHSLFEAMDKVQPLIANFIKQNN